MMYFKRLQKLKLLLSLAISLTASVGFAQLSHSTALDDYIQKPDKTYSWSLEKTTEGKDYTVFIVSLKSQTWRSSQEVNFPLWRHWLIVVRPHKIISDKSLFYIGNGNSKEEIPEQADSKWIELARNTGSVVAELRNVPNQPLIYFNDSEERNEDNSVAYSWDKEMTTQDPTWSIRLPMVKSVVRGMDTVQALMKSDSGGRVQINQFVVAGASKRGWTTWLTAAVDNRVIAIIPLVIDVLNVRKFLQHHYAAYGFWSPAVKDYVRHNILQRYQTPAFSQLMELEDPYSYRERLTVPKYMINATGDEFFLPDSSRFYFDELSGPKYLRYVPNSKHSLKDTDAFQSLGGFYSAILKKTRLPSFSWSKSKDGSIRLVTQDRPQKVNLWQATNPKDRDFRLDVIKKSFTCNSLQEQEEGVYVAKVLAPPHGFTAFFIELTYESGESFPFYFTTEVSVVPDVLPFK